MPNNRTRADYDQLIQIAARFGKEAEATQPPQPTQTIQTPAPTAQPANSLDVSADGVSLIKRWEGFVAGLYDDAAGHCTVGYGHLVHTGKCDGSDSELPWKDGITDERATTLLKEDAASAVQAVRTYVTAPLTQNQFDALVDFTYNVGAGGLSSSDLLANRRKEEGELFTKP